MKQEKLLQDLGTSATVFGLGLLAARKLRPYAKYFVLGGVAISAVPGLMAAVEQIQAKRIKEQPVEEVVITEPCCADCPEEPCPAEATAEGECCEETVTIVEPPAPVEPVK